MAYNAITDAEIASGKPTNITLMTKIQGNDAYFYSLSGSQTSSLGVINGSFEIDSDADGVPDNWTRNLYPGGTGSLYTTAPAHGAQSWSFVHPGGASNGGGYLDSDYFEVSPQILYLVRFILWATVAGIKNMVQVRYYDKDQVELGAGSPETIFTTTTNPASATTYIVQFNPPATTCYAKVRLIGGYTDTDVAGTVYFDDVGLIISPPAVAGEVSMVAHASTEESIAVGSYTKYKEITLAKGGTYTIKFDLKAVAPDGTAFGKIYVNGSGTGTERSTALTDYQTYTEDISALRVGDLLQFYGYKTGEGANMRNFQIYERGILGTHTVTLD